MREMWWNDNPSTERMETQYIRGQRVKIIHNWLPPRQPGWFSVRSGRVGKAGWEGIGEAGGRAGGRAGRKMVHSNRWISPDTSTRVRFVLFTNNQRVAIISHDSVSVCFISMFIKLDKYIYNQAAYSYVQNIYGWDRTNFSNYIRLYPIQIRIKLWNASMHG